ncbi:IclR family transcriptional regulator [Volucribacter amazonae]|uniref:HTH-type transcriptional repressor AllR n=1 Tax=Volucribacter amazonae TaxID=256731 RepID=A0A9X4PEI3_9PAST|nr:IclR family transcriptional regulator [Volucribacter amazonae]MDG6896086.1 hypothetical protein [Volucribacter amazonae]
MAVSKSLTKGIKVIEAIALGYRTLTHIQKHLQLPKTTTHRILKSLANENYIRDVKGIGYVLGTNLIRLGILAQEQMPLKAIAFPYLKKLSEQTCDTVHLGVREGDYVFYLEKIPGNRAIEMRSKIGDRLPLVVTGIGKALMLDLPQTEIEKLIGRYVADHKKEAIKQRMKQYCQQDFSFDLEDNSEFLHCVAVPIRNKYGNIIAAISIASISLYMPTERMYQLVKQLKIVSQQISNDIENHL